MEISEDLVKQEDNAPTLWINHPYFKAIMVGFFFSSGFFLASLFEDNFLIEPESMTKQFFIDIGIPTICVYLVVDLGKKFLMRYGFEGFSNEQGKGFTIIKLVMGILGFFLGIFCVALIIIIPKQTYEIIGGGGIGGSIILLLIGTLAAIALRRRWLSRIEGN